MSNELETKEINQVLEHLEKRPETVLVKVDDENLTIARYLDHDGNVLMKTAREKNNQFFKGGKKYEQKTRKK